MERLHTKPNTNCVGWVEFTKHNTSNVDVGWVELTKPNTSNVDCVGWVQFTKPNTNDVGWLQLTASKTIQL